MLKAIMIIGVVGFSGTALKDYVAQQEAFLSYVEKNRIGNSSNYHLSMINTLDELEHVSFVYGFPDNRAFCKDLAELYMQKYPSSQYFCVKAN
jgi:hypothetical protein